MRNLTFILLSVLVFCGGLYAQTEERVVCPNLDVAASAGKAAIGDMLTFTVRIDTFGKEYKLEYNWTLERAHKSPGVDKPIEIISGQGSPTITVRQVEGGITATIEINGFPRNCDQVASESTFIDPPPDKMDGGPAASQFRECPKINLTGPSAITRPGDTSTYMVQVDTDGKALPLEYLWSVSAGEITSGQGTDTISLKVPGGSITATVEIRGLPEGCPKVASETGYWDPPPKSELIESFRGPITAQDKAVIEKINEAFQQDPNARYVFFLANKNARQLNANKAAIFKYLRTRDIGPPRIIYVDLPANSEVTQFWRVPAGADFPKVSADGMTIEP